MEDRIRKIYCPMTETGFYILYCLQRPQHGYGIGQQVKVMTGNQVVISPGTMYGTLSKMEGDGLIYLESAGRGKDVCLTPEGEALVQRTARRVIQAENQVFAAWPQEDVEQYLALTRRFQEALAQKAREIKEES